MREQRLVFGEVAELYDRARAAYSEAVIDDVLRFAGGDGSRLRALEVGAGTGKATVAFAVRGLAIVAIEPSAAMAAVARRNCKPFPNVRLECTTFEDWAVEANPFDLVFSAQAWHWVTPEVRYVKAAEALSRALLASHTVAGRRAARRAGGPLPSPRPGPLREGPRLSGPDPAPGGRSAGRRDQGIRAVRGADDA
jgi:SAM-dependent methyltransferase